jgi:hypothetical protein
VRRRKADRLACEAGAEQVGDFAGTAFAAEVLGDADAAATFSWGE